MEMVRVIGGGKFIGLLPTFSISTEKCRESALMTIGDFPVRFRIVL
jgi:hypothetical protein